MEILNFRKNKKKNIFFLTPLLKNHFINRWLFSTNHKDIGTLYFMFGVFAAIIGSFYSFLIRTELTEPSSQLFCGNSQLHYLGFMGMPRRIGDYLEIFYNWNWWCTWGSMVSIFFFLLFLYVIFSAFYNSYLINFSGKDDLNALDAKPLFSIFLVIPSQYGFPDAATQVMSSIIIFHNDVMFYLTFFTLFIFFMLVSTIILFSDFYDSERRWGFSSRTTHNKILEIIWTVVPALVLLIIAIPSMGLLYATSEPVCPPQLTVKVTGHQWYWNYNYSARKFWLYIKENFSNYLYRDRALLVSTLNKINFDSYMKAESELLIGQLRLLETDNPLYLPTQTSIRLLVTGMDVIHSWAVPAFGIKTDAIPGRLNQTWLYLMKEGTFYGQCSELCGVNHGFMPIQAIAVGKSAFYDYVIFEMAQKTGNAELFSKLFGNTVQISTRQDSQLNELLMDYLATFLSINSDNLLEKKGTNQQTLQTLIEFKEVYSSLLAAGSENTLLNEIFEVVKQLATNLFVKVSIQAADAADAMERAEGFYNFALRTTESAMIGCSPVLEEMAWSQAYFELEYLLARSENNMAIRELEYILSVFKELDIACDVNKIDWSFFSFSNNNGNLDCSASIANLNTNNSVSAEGIKTEMAFDKLTKDLLNTINTSLSSMEASKIISSKEIPLLADELTNQETGRTSEAKAEVIANGKSGNFTSGTFWHTDTHCEWRVGKVASTRSEMYSTANKNSSGKVSSGPYVAEDSPVGNVSTENLLDYKLTNQQALQWLIDFKEVYLRLRGTGIQDNLLKEAFEVAQQVATDLFVKVSIQAADAADLMDEAARVYNFALFNTESALIHNHPRLEGRVWLQAYFELKYRLAVSENNTAIRELEYISSVFKKLDIACDVNKIDWSLFNSSNNNGSLDCSASIANLNTNNSVRAEGIKTEMAFDELTKDLLNVIERSMGTMKFFNTPISFKEIPLLADEFTTQETGLPSAVTVEIVANEKSSNVTSGAAPHPAASREWRVCELDSTTGSTICPATTKNTSGKAGSGPYVAADPAFSNPFSTPVITPFGTEIKGADLPCGTATNQEALEALIAFSQETWRNVPILDGYERNMEMSTTQLISVLAYREESEKFFRILAVDLFLRSGLQLLQCFHYVEYTKELYDLALAKTENSATKMLPEFEINVLWQAYYELNYIFSIFEYNAAFFEFEYILGVIQELGFADNARIINFYNFKGNFSKTRISPDISATTAVAKALNFVDMSEVRMYNAFSEATKDVLAAVEKFIEESKKK